ncbi:branched-chain alpha-ketoacid dehydrogenase [Globomyces pollinis-pini]|nr:branched-chain alpha-ketoacid dehydrogenase [Globomyces pollinis-pini]
MYQKNNRLLKICIQKQPQMLDSKRTFKVDFYQNRILEKYANKEPNSVTLRQLTLFGRTASQSEEKLLKSANYIREELPIRIAHRIRMFQQLPFVTGTNPHIEKVYKLYWEAFETFISVNPITDLEQNKAFCEIVQKMLNTHAVVIPHLVKGMQESQVHMNAQECNKFMNETLQSRISRRVLAEQHIAITKSFEKKKHSNLMIGVVHSECKANEAVQKCYKLAGKLFTDAFLTAPPELILDGHTHAKFTYIPAHIEYILFELIKNSMRFTAKTHLLDPSLSELPPIRITIGVGDNQVMFRVSDQGGGIDKDTFDTLWNFVKNDPPSDLDNQTELLGKVEELVPLTSTMGIGLPMSRVYANYWGGSMSLFSMYGYGTDAYVTIHTGNSLENLSYNDSEDK